MPAFLSAVLTIVVIGVAAPLILNSFGWSSAQVFKMQDVRLDSYDTEK